MVGQNTQNKAASKNADNAHATALGDVQNSTNQAVSRMDALYKGTPNPLAGMHAPTGPQQGGGGHAGGGIMGQGGHMQAPPQGGGQQGMAGLEQMIRQFLQGQGQHGGGQRHAMGGASALPPQLPQPFNVTPPPQPFNVTPPPPMPTGNPPLPMHPRLMGDGALQRYGNGRGMPVDF